MTVNISGDNVELTATLRQYVDQKITNLHKFNQDIIDIEVVLRLEKLGHTAEAKVNVPHKTLFAQATAEDMYGAIDALRDKLAGQIKHHKNKHNHHH